MLQTESVTGERLSELPILYSPVIRADLRERGTTKSSSLGD